MIFQSVQGWRWRGPSWQLRAQGRANPGQDALPSQALTHTHSDGTVRARQFTSQHVWGVGGNQRPQRKPTDGENVQTPHRQWPQLGVSSFFLSSMFWSNDIIWGLAVLTGEEQGRSKSMLCWLDWKYPLVFIICYLVDIASLRIWPLLFPFPFHFQVTSDGDTPVLFGEIPVTYRIRKSET